MGRTVMIVGNGEIPEGAAGLIDAADLVIRFNDCRSAGTGGTRTDIVAVCNTGRPGKAMIESESWKANPYVQAADTVWCTRNSEKFAAMKPSLSITHPELDDFCDNYTQCFRTFCTENGKQLHVFSASTHAALEEELKALGAVPFVVPSTGLLTISEFLRHFSEPEDHVVLAGFGHSGWEWHPWDAERRWLERHAEAGRVSRIAVPTRAVPYSSHHPPVR